MWIVAGSGFIGSLIALIFSLIPPAQIDIGSKTLYFGILVSLTTISCALPFIVYKIKKPSWRDPNSDFAPFTWEKKD